MRGRALERRRIIMWCIWDKRCVKSDTTLIPVLSLFWDQTRWDFPSQNALKHLEKLNLSRRPQICKASNKWGVAACMVCKMLPRSTMQVDRTIPAGSLSITPTLHILSGHTSEFRLSWLINTFILLWLLHHLTYSPIIILLVWCSVKEKRWVNDWNKCLYFCLGLEQFIKKDRRPRI